MANNNDGGYSSNRSAFGGFMLEGAENVDGKAVSKLADYGITDAEQVIALAALPDVRPNLEKAIGKADLDTLVTALRDEVGEAAADAVEHSAPATLPMGAIEPTAEIQAEIAALAGPPMADAMPVALPPSVNHALSMSPIRNQGNRGTCVSFAMTAMHEFFRRKQGFARDYSEQFLYHRTKQIDGIPNSCGTWAVKAAQVLGGQGQCLEATWPYNPNPPCNNNGVQPANAAAQAASHKLACIVLNPKNVAAIKAAIASGCVCEFSIPVWNSWYQSAATKLTGRITMKLPGDTMAGGHAMCIIGYQDTPLSPGGGFFIIRNSWGTVLWGSQCPYGAGNGTIPYAYIAQDGWEAVTTNVPRRRWWPFHAGEGDEGGEGGEPDARRTIIIEDSTANIIIR